MTPQISVCILAGHDAHHLERCLSSLSSQSDAPSFELLVGGKLSADSRSLVQRRFPSAGLCDTGSRLPGSARNALVERAQGEVLLFLDDDITAPDDLLQTLATLVAGHPEAAVFGGPNDSPPQSSRFESVQGAVLGSLIGSGPVSRRYGARQPCYADERWFTLCNLAVRRRTMLPFAKHLVCAEENALLDELRAEGVTMRYEPTLRVFHARRPTLPAFIRQMFKYGRGRGQLMVRSPRTTRLAYLAPSLLLIYALLAGLTYAVGRGALPSLAPLGLYGALVLATALRIGWVFREPVAIPIAVGLIVTLHVAYGAGVVAGVLGPHGQRQELPVSWIDSEGSITPHEHLRPDGPPRLEGQAAPPALRRSPASHRLTR